MRDTTGSPLRYATGQGSDKTYLLTAINMYEAHEVCFLEIIPAPVQITGAGILCGKVHVCSGDDSGSSYVRMCSVLTSDRSWLSIASNVFFISSILLQSNVR